jgi:DNA-binding MarR family transcriptional regulator
MTKISTDAQLILDAIYNDPGLSVEEIADETELDETRVRRTLAALENRSLVLALGDDSEHRYITRAAAGP